ncbi:hypothetical protein BC939DRAFT_174366 [Gamsiella multidivaricata]|uniref:uncharacterized protein n=1 Tax=Gamsiella multidivaricata TaxID=101098 RepID=UPI00221F70DD|nr:uncharacterized protein BC939DRAFT_174366 [Gamsiella multidivaricata]KAG0364579.1 hypothetical protein BGZ54_007360 [Gamsiella multidivaricata]KAI7822947.1 hypothetical protein BC939DRAFT_174366 [Gamsiella multidivaricata]
MGGIISRLRQSNDSDYERILSDLDSNIRKAELRLSAIHFREKRLMGRWLFYGALLWIGYTTVFVLYLNQQYHDNPQTWALALAPVVIGLPIIYAGRSVINVWYKRAKTNEESQLSMLRADQRLKVEELKKKTAYYSTKTLLERYDPSSQRSNGPRTGPDGRPIAPSQNGQPKTQQTNMMDPGLRQRQGPGIMNSQGIPAGPGRPIGVSSGAQHHQQSQMRHGPQNTPRGPQGPYPQQPSFPSGPSPYGSTNTERHWYDKIVDVIVGDEGPDTKYALICGQCHAHNGLALPQEIDDIQYVCPKCNFFNQSRRKTRLAVAGINPLSTSDMTLLQAQAKPLPVSREPSPAPSTGRLPFPEHRDHLHYVQNGPEPAVGSPEPVSAFPLTVDALSHSETDDIEFANNWNDSDVEGVNHDEGEDYEEDDTDEASGYIVDSGEEPKRSTRTTRASTGAKTKPAVAKGSVLTGKRKSKRA